MLSKRIIACLDVDSGRVVKGKQFADLRDAGDPPYLARLHAEHGADEIVLLDISATRQARSTMLEVVRRTASGLFVPLTVGGGISSLHDAQAVFHAGADKIAINSAAFLNPTLLSEIASEFGSQAIVLAVDAKADAGDYEVWLAGGSRPTGRNVLSWCLEAQARGVGEILLTSMDRDGTGCGFDCDLTRSIALSVRIPVIASGGAGIPSHFVDVFRHGADAALAASVFHCGSQSIHHVKRQLLDTGIPVRWPC